MNTPLAIYIVRHNSVVSESGGNTTILGNKKVHYKYLGHKRYLLKYDAPKYGGWLGEKNIKDYITKKGTKIIVKGKVALSGQYYKVK